MHIRLKLTLRTTLLVVGGAALALFPACSSSDTNAVGKVNTGAGGTVGKAVGTSGGAANVTAGVGGNRAGGIGGQHSSGSGGGGGMGNTAQGGTSTTAQGGSSTTMQGGTSATAQGGASTTGGTSTGTLQCQLNISRDGKYLQKGPISGTGPRWIMKGAFDNVMRFTPDGNDPTGWEFGSYNNNNWANRSAQMDAMKAAGVNTIRIWHFSINVGNPAHEGTGTTAAMEEMTSFIALAKKKGLFVLVEQWWPGYLKLGASDAYYDTGEWHDWMIDYIQHFAAAGLDNVLFGTGNEPDNSPDPAWQGSWTDNSKRYVAAMRRLGYTGPVLCDTPGQDNKPWGNETYADIQNSDPSKNVGFQEHEYGWDRNSIIPVSKATVNGQPVYRQFPIFITEAGQSVNQQDLDDWAFKAINEGLGGAIIFWWNAPGNGTPTIDADGIHLNDYGILWRDHFFRASGMPEGFANE